MKRVAIFGNTGAGKSTLAKKLSAVSNLPLHALDLIQYRPGGGVVPVEQYRNEHDKILAQDEWIIDGFGDYESLWKRLAVADTLIHIDLPLYKHFFWVTKRFFKGLVSTPEGWPENSPLFKSTISSYRVLRLCHKHMTPKYRKYISDARTSKEVYALRSVSDMKAFLTAVEEGLSKK